LRRSSRRPGRQESSDGRRPSAGKGRDTVLETIKIEGDLGSHAVEALRLEIRRLAARCGLAIKEIRIETVEEEGSG
jgi:hypothetical protein